LSGIFPAFFTFSIKMSIVPKHSGGRHQLLPHPLLFAASVVLAAMMWLIFVGTDDRHEMLVGTCACAATLIFTWHLSRSTGKPIVLKIRDVAQCGRIPWYIASGVFEISMILLKDMAGVDRARNLYRVSGFEAAIHDPLRIARTSLAVAFTTTAPNFIVIGIDPAQSRMLFHQLKRSGVPKMTKALGARP
jgi:hypothetical protein